MKKEEIWERLSSLENNVIRTFNENTNYEHEKCDESIKYRIARLENMLNHYRMDSPEGIDNKLREFKGKLSKVKTIISMRRDDEKHYTVDNLQNIRSELEETISDLEQFEMEGIKPWGQDNYYYENDVNKMVDNEVHEFLQKHNITDPRIVDEIENEVKLLKRELVRHHDEISYTIKSTITSKVEMIGGELIARKDEPQKNEKSPIPGLEGLVAEKKDVAQYDIRSENEKAFRDVPGKNDKVINDNEAMFK